MSAPAVTAPGRAGVRAATCPPDELPQVAHALLADLVGGLPGAVSATVVTVAPGAGPTPWATSGPAGHDLDAVQAAAGDGPAVTAAADPGRLVTARDAWTDPRWRLPADRARSPVRSVVAVALHACARGRAVLAVHGTGADLVELPVIAQVEAAVPELAAALAVVRARSEVADLRLALEGIRTVGAAVGVAMATRKLTYEAAGELLASLGDRTGTPLVDLAGTVLAGGRLPGA